MKLNFEKCFWIPQEKTEDALYDVPTNLVKRRGIYKDVYKSSVASNDLQLRPNICIAMSYAPDLFDQKHARTCLIQIAHILMEQGCMGIKTLDPLASNYNGNYVNSDSTDGWNYH